MVVGNYGSGKTEVSVNLALHLAQAGRTVQIADLDIVNPYFRSREARRLMEEHGIRVVVPPGRPGLRRPADRPARDPRACSHPPEGVLTLFDVGGDDVGARALAAFRPVIREGAYQLWQVINARRPFTSTVEGCLQMQGSIETASRLTVTGLLANTHLIEQTTPEIVVDGWRLRRAGGRRVRPARPLRRRHGGAGRRPALAEIERARAPHAAQHASALAPVRRAQAGDDDLPAARSVPIGKPPNVQFPRPRGERHG